MRFLSNIINSMRNPESSIMSIKPNEYLYLKDENDKNVYTLISYAPELKKDLLVQFENKFSYEDNPQYNVISNTIVDKIGALGTAIASGIQAGGLMQIIGPPEVVEGLANGSMRLMKTAIGNTGSVLREGSSAIFKQAKFTPANVASIIAPVMVYQLLNAVAGVYQLSKINARLDCLQRLIESIQFRQQANSYGRLYASINTLEEINREYSVIKRFTEDMRVRLIIATQDIYKVSNESSLIIKRFQQMSKDLMYSNSKKNGAIKANAMLKEEMNVYIIDANIYMVAAKAGLMAEEMWIKHDLQFVPEYVGYRIKDLQNEVDILQEAISPMLSIFELQNYAEDCLKEMGKFRRLFIPRAKHQILDRKKQLEDNKDFSDKCDTAQSMFIWMDNNNNIKVLSSSEIITSA